MPTARDLLLARVMEHVATSGIGSASLRELAEAVGSSHRMLIYHFGSRDGLVAAVVASMEDQQRVTLARIADRAGSPAEVITEQWPELTSPAVLPFVRLFFEVLAQASYGRPGTDGFLDRLTEPWLDTAAGVAERIGAVVDRDEIRLGVAVVRGLLIEVLASGDTGPATASLERFVQMLELRMLGRPCCGARGGS